METTTRLEERWTKPKLLSLFKEQVIELERDRVSDHTSGNASTAP